MAKDKDGYPCEPRNIEKDAWFYEQREGLVIVCQAHKPAITNVTIPWRKISAALRRHEAAKAKRK